MELVGERYRPALGTAIQIGYSVSFMLQAAIAYVLRDEFWYQVAAGTPNFLILILTMYVCSPCFCRFAVDSAQLLNNQARTALTRGRTDQSVTYLPFLFRVCSQPIAPFSCITNCIANFCCFWIWVWRRTVVLNLTLMWSLSSGLGQSPNKMTLEMLKSLVIM